jgi:hypothetical protein
MKVTDEMLNRFLSWKLPIDFSPDCGISFDGRKPDQWNPDKGWPIGTNLLTATQAKAMLEHVLAPRSETACRLSYDPSCRHHASAAPSAGGRSMNEARAIGLLRAVRDEWYTFTPYSELKTAIDGLLDNAPQSASVSIKAHEEALVELNLLRSQTRELAERCRPAVAHDARLRERDAHSDKYAHTYKPVLKAEAERAAKLLDDIDAILGARSVAPHRSGGPVADGTPKPEHASPDSGTPI